MRRVLRLLGAQQELAVDPRPMQVDVRMGAAFPGGANERNDDGLGHIERVDEHALAFFQLGGKTGENLGQLVATWIGYHDGNVSTK